MKKQSIYAVICLLLLTVAVTGAQSQKSQSAATNSSVPQKPGIDPCALLTSADIQAVQGDVVLEAKPSAQRGGGLMMSQCLFRTATPSKSVSIAVATPSSLSPCAFWRKQFHSGKTEGEKAGAKDATGPTEKTAVASKEKEEDESTPPRPISGVGEEAYWIGGPMIGALYVLKGDTFFRISLGGIRQEPPRIQKSIVLARAALKRF